MTQSQGPLTTPCWFHIHISYRFGGDAPINVPAVAKMSKFGRFPIGLVNPAKSVGGADFFMHLLCFTSKSYQNHRRRRFWMPLLCFTSKSYQNSRRRRFCRPLLCFTSESYQNPPEALILDAFTMFY